MKKIFFLSLVSLLLLASLMIWNNKTDDATSIKVNGINTFKPKPSQQNDHYLLFYPADRRFSKENTIIKEVDKTGKVIREYEVIDQDFGRMFVHQKPNDLNQIYISFFGEARIDNFYFTYDIKNKMFNKVKLDYFDYTVGVDHIMHYGNDVLFPTTVSHKTGEQNIDPKTNEFNVSISDYTQKVSFETEYGYVPKWAPLLSFNHKVLYATSGTLNVATGKYEKIGIGLIDLSKQKVQYEMFNSHDTDYFPLYASDEHAYILSNSGRMYVYDKSFQYKIVEPFKNLPKQDWYYNQEFPHLLIGEHTILTSVYHEGKGSTVGFIELEPEPIFKSLDKSYLSSNFYYKFLYQDTENEEIYVLQKNEDEAYLLVMDNKNFELKDKIPMKYGRSLDFAIRI